MRRLGLHAIAALAAVLAVASCGKKGKVISRSDLEDIYVDLFLADQWLVHNQSESDAADTLMFYEPVFRSHGCTTEDYVESVNHYLHDPKRYARILKRADARISSMLEKARSEVDEVETIRSLRRAAEAYHPDLKLYYDTLYVRITKEAGLRFVADSAGRYLPFVPEPEPLDSAALDSLARLDSLALADSLAAVDSLVLKDSLSRLDSVIAPPALPEALPGGPRRKPRALLDSATAVMMDEVTETEKVPVKD